MNCFACGSEMTTAVENHAYVEAGLPAVTLLAVEIRRCPCGESELVLPALESIHRQIMQALVAKAGRLAAEEMRFLRKFAGYSGVDMARRVGVAPETLSRWENGAQDVGVGSDRLLRVVVMAAAGESLQPSAFLTMASAEGAEALRLSVAASAAPPAPAETQTIQAPSATASAGVDWEARPVRLSVARLTSNAAGTSGPGWSDAA